MKGKAVVKGLFDYNAQTGEELSFAEGDLLIITDDSDPEWWDAKVLSADAFTEQTQGCIPASYVERAEYAAQYTASFDYEARSDDELSFNEGAILYIYNTSDPDWWLALFDREVGLVPVNYMEEATEVSVAHIPANESAINQKHAFLGVLDGLGFAPIKKAPALIADIAPSPVSSVPVGPPSSSIAPVDIKYYTVTELDKKKKKNSRKGQMGISDDGAFIIYFVHDGAIAQQFNFTDLIKYSEKKGKRIILETPGGTFEYEGEKADIQALFNILEESKTKSKMSRPIITGPPPFIGVDVSNKERQSSSSRPSILASSQQSPLPFAAEPKIAVALYDYESQTDEEISIRENDNLMVLDDSDPDWTLVKIVSKKGGQGIVPKTYIEARLGDDGPSLPPSLPEVKDRIPIIMPRPKISERPPLISERPAEKISSTAPRMDRNSQISSRPAVDRAPSLSKRPTDKPPPISERPVERPPLIAVRPVETPPPIANRPAERPPSIAPRPDNNTIPPMSARPVMPAATPTIPSRPLISSRPVESKKDVATVHDCMINVFTKIVSPVPDKSKIRQWTDKSGSFKIEAQYLSLTQDGKVQLHKLNGVKIYVPLEKLCQADSYHVKSLPENEKIGVRIVSKQPLPGRKNVEISGPALVKAADSGGAKNEFTHNGFDWKSWLIAANVDPADAKLYAVKFAEQKMDKSALVDLEREVLRVLGVAEGDIIRIRKAVGQMPGVPSQQAEKERIAQEKNMQLLGTLRQNKTQSPSQSNFPTKFNNVGDQLMSDEAYARELQNEEFKRSGSGPTAGNQSSRTTETFDQKTLQQAKDILNAQNQREAAEALAAVAITSTSSDDRRKALDSIPTNSYVNASSNDPWSTNSARASIISTTSSINPSSSVSQRFNPLANSSAPPNQSRQPLMAPLIATPMANLHNTFVPTNIGNPNNSFVPTGSGPSNNNSVSFNSTGVSSGISTSRSMNFQGPPPPQSMGSMSTQMPNNLMSANFMPSPQSMSQPGTYSTPNQAQQSSMYRTLNSMPTSASMSLGFSSPGAMAPQSNFSNGGGLNQQAAINSQTLMNQPSRASLSSQPQQNSYQPVMNQSQHQRPTLNNPPLSQSGSIQLQMGGGGSNSLGYNAQPLTNGGGYGFGNTIPAYGGANSSIGNTSMSGSSILAPMSSGGYQTSPMLHGYGNSGMGSGANNLGYTNQPVTNGGGYGAPNSMLPMNTPSMNNTNALYSSSSSNSAPLSGYNNQTSGMLMSGSNANYLGGGGYDGGYNSSDPYAALKSSSSSTGHSNYQTGTPQMMGGNPGTGTSQPGMSQQPGINNGQLGMQQQNPMYQNPNTTPNLYQNPNNQQWR